MKSSLISIVSMITVAASLSASAAVTTTEIDVNVQGRAIPNFSDRTAQKFASEDRAVNQSSAFIGTSGRAPAVFDHRDAIDAGGQLVDTRGRK